jgi:hypothetical protein
MIRSAGILPAHSAGETPALRIIFRLLFSRGMRFRVSLTREKCGDIPSVFHFSLLFPKDTRPFSSGFFGPRQTWDNRDAVFLEEYEAFWTDLLPTRFFTTAVMIGIEPLAARSVSNFDSPSVKVVVVLLNFGRVRLIRLGGYLPEWLKNCRSPLMSPRIADRVAKKKQNLFGLFVFVRSRLGFES